MPQLPPRMICIVAALSVCVGTNSVIQMLIELISRDGLHLDLGFVGINVGYGLFAGKQTSRRWAIVLSCLFLVVQLVGFLIMVFSDASKSMLPPDWSYFISINLLYSVCFVLALFVLLSERNKQWFDDSQSAPSHSLTFVLSVGAVASILLLQHHAKETWIGATQARVYAIDVVIEVYDATTGEGLNSSGGGTYEPEEMYLPLEFPKISVGTIVKDDVIQHEISAIAVKPIEYVVAAPGYQKKVVVIDALTDQRLRVELEPIEQADPDLKESNQAAVALKK